MGNDWINLINKRFSQMQRESLEQVLGMMRDRGVLDRSNSILKLTEEEALTVFEIYYEAYLKKRKEAGKVVVDDMRITKFF